MAFSAVRNKFCQIQFRANCLSSAKDYCVRPLNDILRTATSLCMSSQSESRKEARIEGSTNATAHYFTQCSVCLCWTKTILLPLLLPASDSEEVSPCSTGLARVRRPCCDELIFFKRSSSGIRVGEVTRRLWQHAWQSAAKERRAGLGLE
jgi:hypothetical protein